ncbi:MAG: hypothetical protein HC933_06830 [Pleurocapsa sp. SU_196_0]|nr:hypothetical protein [Pleurocapsa sp. SU_196_0]
MRDCWRLPKFELEHRVSRVSGQKLGVCRGKPPSSQSRTVRTGSLARFQIRQFALGAFQIQFLRRVSRREGDSGLELRDGVG